MPYKEWRNTSSPHLVAMQEYEWVDLVTVMDESGGSRLVVEQRHPSEIKEPWWKETYQYRSFTTIREWAIDCHRKVNHKYGDDDYSVHLGMVAAVARKFQHLIPEKDFPDVVAACYCHDLIEDARKTYNDVLKNTNFVVAEITYALTNEKGKTRAERANDKYYEGIKAVLYADFVKICDRCGNMEYSKESGSGMIDVYRRELDNFIEKLYNPQYKEMFDYLRTI